MLIYFTIGLLLVLEMFLYDKIIRKVKVRKSIYVVSFIFWPIALLMRAVVGK